MEGIISAIFLGRNSNKKYGFIKGDDGSDYYFDSRYIENGFSMNEYQKNEKVEFSIIKQENKHDIAKNVRKFIEEPVKFYTPGNFLRMNKRTIYDIHLKKSSSGGSPSCRCPGSGPLPLPLPAAGASGHGQAAWSCSHPWSG